MKAYAGFSRASLAALLLVLAACGDSDTPGAPESVSVVRVTPTTRELLPGQTAELQALALADGGAPLEGRPVTWSTEDGMVATVSASGVVTAVRPGATRIVATIEGKAGKAQVTVVAPPVAGIVVSADSLTLEEGQAHTLAAVAVDAQGNPVPGVTVEWAALDATVAAVAPTGRVTGLKAGATQVTATAGPFTARILVKVAPPPPVVDRILLPSATMTLAVGDTRTLSAFAVDAQGMPVPGVTVQWHSTQPQVATVSPGGELVALGVGTTQIVASAAGRSGVMGLVVRTPVLFDLMYDSRTGPFNEPQIHRLDLLTGIPQGVPVPVIMEKGALQASPSPDGFRMVFTGTHNHGTSIFMANIDGSGVVMLTDGTNREDQPVWSPDGTRIAFRRWAPGGPPGIFNPAHIWVMNADGTGQVNLTAGAQPGVTFDSPTWSPRLPDGSYRIAFSRQEKVGDWLRGRIWSIRANRTDLRPVTQGGEYLEDSPSWSPDGTTILFTRIGGTALSDLWLVNAGGGSERQLLAVNPDGEQRHPVWSPDGEHIAFTSAHEILGNHYGYQVYTMRADGSELTRWTSGTTEKENLAWVRRQ
jgi:uncharacterized protein YjdB